MTCAHDVGINDTEWQQEQQELSIILITNINWYSEEVRFLSFNSTVCCHECKSEQICPKVVLVWSTSVVHVHMTASGEVGWWDVTDMWQGGTDPSLDELVASPRSMCQGLALSLCQAWVASWHALECVCHVRLRWNCSWTHTHVMTLIRCHQAPPPSPDGVCGKSQPLSLPSDFSQPLTLPVASFSALVELSCSH